MSWLTKVSDLAGKAENLLNQLDQNTADALQKTEVRAGRSTKYTPLHTKRTSSISHGLASNMTSNPELREYAYSDYGGGTVIEKCQTKSSGYSSSSVSNFTSKNQPNDENDKLMAYLNETNNDMCSIRGSLSRKSSDGSQASMPSLMLVQSAFASQALHTSEGVGDKIKIERTMNELRARDDDAQKTMQTKDSQLAVLQIRLQESDQLLQTRSQQFELLKSDRQRNHADARTQEMDAIQRQLSESETAFEREEMHTKQIEAEYQQRLEKLEDEARKLAQAVTEAQKNVVDEKLRSKDAVDQLRLAKYNLEANKHDFDEYRQKAQRILQTKEQLIEKLKMGSLIGEEQTGLTVEIEEIRAEKDMVKDDLQQAQLTVYNLKTEIQDLESQLASEQRGSLEQQRGLQEQCQTFQGFASQYREQLEQAKLYSILECNPKSPSDLQEYQCIQDELRRQQTTFHDKLLQKDAELIRVMNQSAARSLNVATNGELEQRMRQLTENLVQKQTMIETLQTDKYSLGLQLERLERTCGEAEAAAFRSASLGIQIGVESEGYNPRIRLGLETAVSAGVSSRVPIFLREQPCDSGVTKRIKRAYGSLDSLSAKAGLLLRRYPVVRVLMFVYCVVMHLWVFFVLFTYSPEIHASDSPPGHSNG